MQFKFRIIGPFQLTWKKSRRKSFHFIFIDSSPLTSNKPTCLFFNITLMKNYSQWLANFTVLLFSFDWLGKKFSGLSKLRKLVVKFDDGSILSEENKIPNLFFGEESVKVGILFIWMYSVKRHAQKYSIRIETSLLPVKRFKILVLSWPLKTF